MNWQDRTREAAYTSPNGNRFVFNYDVLDREFDKNTSAYNFPGIEGTYVQDLGSTDRRYPMRVIFWGKDHDTVSQQFADAIREVGRGRLEHPRDGRIDVVPFGTVKFREDLVRSANQTIIEVEFWEATIVLYPSGDEDPGGQVINEVNATLDASADTFASGVDILTAVNRASLRNRFGVSVGTVRSVLAPIVGTDPEKLRQFNVVADSIVVGLDSLISTPRVLADQLNILTLIPATSDANIGAKFDGYTSLISTFTSADNPDAALRSSLNDFRNDELYSTAALSGLIVSSVEAEYGTRTEATSAAAEIVSQFDQVNTWREINYGGLA